MPYGVWINSKFYRFKQNCLCSLYHLLAIYSNLIGVWMSEFLHLWIISVHIIITHICCTETNNVSAIEYVLKSNPFRKYWRLYALHLDVVRFIIANKGSRTISSLTKGELRTTFTCIREYDIRHSHRSYFRPINVLDHHMRTCWFPILFLDKMRYARSTYMFTRSTSHEYTFVYRLTCNKSALCAASARRHWANCHSMLVHESSAKMN